MMKFKLKVPATSANLGPGFDFLGVGLDIYNEYLFEENKDNQIKLVGFSVEVSDNYVLKGYKAVFEYLNLPTPSVTITEVKRDIPVARGMGSSSAALACGIIAGNKMAGNKLSNAERDRLAVKLEGHPDNIIPCLHGDLVTTVVNDNELIIEKLEVRSDLSFILFIPKYKVKTIEARNALPKSYSLSDVTSNASRVILMPKAFLDGDIEVLKKIMVDKVHEPYRLKLIKEYDIIKNALKDEYCTFNISGSGPTMISITNRKNEEKIKKIVEDLHLDIDILITSRGFGASIIE